jgi:subtilisin
MAPGAEVVFAAAGADDSERLPSARVANAIDHLAQRIGCDFISVSAGDCPEPLPEIEAAVQDAWDAGTVCFFASGNLCPDTEILYPARYPECLSVAALGVRGFAPEGTEEHLHDIGSKRDVVEGLYWWRHSSVIDLADFLAAGSNVIWTADHRASGAVNGTSFACPIAVGAAAGLCARDPGYLALGRTAARSRHALELARQQALPVKPLSAAGGRPAGVNYGIIRA